MARFLTEFAASQAAFLSAARAAGAELAHHPHPLPGPGGIKVGVDVAIFGAARPESVLFLTSGAHGVELAAGSACQIDLMASGRLATLPPGLRVVLIHAANPFGAAWLRRYTEENVDLCRNFLADWTSPPPVQPGFDVLKEAVNTPADGDTKAADAVIDQYEAEHGLAGLYAALMAGQYRDAQGIGFGGHGPTWARRTLEAIMRESAGDAGRIVALDYHTGVGPYAYGCMVAVQRGQRLQAARDQFGPWIMAVRENPPPEAVDPMGHSTDGYEALFPGRDVMAQVLEVGTYPPRAFLNALIAEHRATQTFGHDSDDPRLAQARLGLLRFFIPDDRHWEDYVLHRGRQAFEQVLETLGTGSVA